MIVDTERARAGRARSDQSAVASQTRSGARARLLAGLPVDIQRMDVNGVDTSVMIGGRGAPLVLLHGGIECGGVYWGRVIGLLATRYRVIVPDAPGIGESAPLGQLDAESFAKWFDTLLTRTCAEPPMLAAHSLLGTYVTRFVAARRPQLRQLVIYAAPGVARYHMPFGLLVTAVRFELRPTRRNHERFESFALLDRERTRQLGSDWFDAFSSYCVERARVPHVKHTMRRLVRDGTKQIPVAELRRIDVPTTLLWGRHDRMAPLALAQAAHLQLGWPLRIIEDAAHVPHMEQPHAFVDALREAIVAP